MAEFTQGVLSVRVYRGLTSAGIATIEDLAKRTVDEIRSVPAIRSMARVKEVEAYLASHGLSLRADDSAIANRKAKKARLDAIRAEFGNDRRRMAVEIDALRQRLADSTEPFS